MEDDIIILLRKILAISSPDYFDAIEDIDREIILMKLDFSDIFLYDIVNDFLVSLEKYLLNKRQIQLKNLKNDIRILKNECKSKHINIEYELDQLLKNGNII